MLVERLLQVSRASSPETMGEQIRQALKPEMTHLRKPDVIELLKELKAKKEASLLYEVMGILSNNGRVKLGLPHYTIGISTCAAARRWQLAVQLFDSMPKDKVTPVVISNNSTISACE